MNDALYVAATGMRAQTAQLDAIANNVANMATPGYKRATVRFGDLVAPSPVGDPMAAASADNLPTALAGVTVQSLMRHFAPGDLRRSDDRMQLAIQGDGFLEVQLADGSTAYWRGGRLEVNADRLLTTADGQVLRQRIQVPPEVTQVQVGEDGQVLAQDEAGRRWSLGRLELTVFAQPGALRALGQGLWQAQPAAGDAQSLTAGEDGAGTLKQGYIEGSNVQLGDEMVQLMVAQRAYEMSVKVMQAADEVAAMTNNLRK